MADFGESQLSFLMGFHRNRKDGNQIRKQKCRIRFKLVLKHTLQQWFQTTALGPTVVYLDQRFYSLFLKKAKNLQQILAKNSFFSLHQSAGQLFYSQKNELFLLKTQEKALFWGAKQSTSILVQSKKTLFFAKVCCKFLDLKKNE